MKAIAMDTKGKTSCILLHGWGQSGNHMHLLGELLADKYTVHILTLPGFGESAPPASVWSAEDYAYWLNDYLEEKKIASCLVAGHSFGGKVALSFAYLFPEKIERLILLAPSGLKKRRPLKERALLFFKVFTYKFLRFFSLRTLQKQWQEAFASKDYSQSDGVMRAVLVKSVNEDVGKKLSSISCPTTILWGKKDTETPVDLAYRFSKLIQGSTLHVFPKFDHYLLDGVRPHLLARYILKGDQA